MTKTKDFKNLLEYLKSIKLINKDRDKSDIVLVALSVAEIELLISETDRLQESFQELQTHVEYHEDTISQIMEVLDKRVG